MGLSKLHIRTFGCQMNEYDSDKMSDVLKYSHGLELTDDVDQALGLHFPFETLTIQKF